MIKLLIRDKRWKNLALLAISKNRQKYNVTRKNMQNLVDSVKELGFHFILIDCPAGIDVGFINAISPAQEAVDCNNTRNYGNSRC